MTDAPHTAQPSRPSLYQVFGGAAEPAPAQIAAADLGGRLSALSAAARRVRHEQDPEAVHDLRVASRRLTAAIDLWTPVLDARGARRARRRTRRMRRDLATLRDLEVLSAIVRERALASTAEARPALEAVLADAERRLSEQRAAAPQAASRRRIRRVRRALDRSLRSASSPAAAPSARELADAHVGAMRERAILALETGWSSGNDEDLHAARIRVKRWRYAIECRAGISTFPPVAAVGDGPHARAAQAADAALPRAEREFLKRLRSLQEALGRIQDLALVREHLESAARRALLHSRPADAAALQSTIARLAPARALAAAEAQRLSTTLSGGRAAD